MPALESFALHARYVFPVSGPPIASGYVSILGQRIAAVSSVRPDVEIRELGAAAILPGLINAHTHLEFSHLAEPIGRPGTPFPEWIRQVVRNRRSGPGISDDSVARGLQESLRCGTTTLGEIASPGWPLDVFRPSGSDGLIFLESIGLAAEKVAAKLEEARRHLNRPFQDWSSTAWRAGLSPHAPYTVHPELFAGLVELAVNHGVPLAFHLAESLEELELLRTGGGPFKDLLRDLDAWDPAAIPLKTRPLDYLRRLANCGRSLIIHGNYLDDEEIAVVGSHADRMAVVYCPRTHGYFGHRKYPLAKMLNAGVRVCLGTDSRASNPDLSLLEEMRTVAQAHPDLPGATILAMGTLETARALGLDAEVGTIEPGKYANLAVLRLPDSEAEEPHALLFESLQPIARTFYRGITTGNS